MEDFIMSHQRKSEDKRRLKRLYEETKNGYGAGAWYNDKKDRLIKYSCHSTWLKRYCSKITRTRMKTIFENPREKCNYKKYFDYWWILL
jgi:hypothetical protein